MNTSLNVTNVITFDTNYVKTGNATNDVTMALPTLSVSHLRGYEVVLKGNVSGGKYRFILKLPAGGQYLVIGNLNGVYSGGTIISDIESYSFGSRGIYLRIS